MARVTVEDCILNVPDLFELIVLAAQRSREISAGASLTVDRDNDKMPVVALREIAAGTLALDRLRESVIGNFQHYVESIDSSLDVQEFFHEEEKPWVVQSSLEEGLSPEVLGEEGATEDGGPHNSNLYSS